MIGIDTQSKEDRATWDEFLDDTRLHPVGLSVGRRLMGDVIIVRSFIVNVRFWGRGEV